MTIGAPAGSLALRLTLAAALWIILALGGGGLLLSNLYRASVERSFDQHLDNLLDGLIAGVDVEADGSLVLKRLLADPRFGVPYSGWYWQVAAVQAPSTRLHSRSIWDLELQFTVGTDPTEPRKFTMKGPENQTLRVARRMIRDGDLGNRYVFFVAGDRAEILSDIGSFDASIFWSLLAFGTTLIVGASLQVRYGLRPLARIRGAISDIRAGKTDVLEGDFPTEVQPLVRELNGLMDHTRVLLDRARTHVGNLAHAIKTPLSVLANDANAESTNLGKSVLEQVSVMQRQIDHYLTLARLAGQADVLGADTELVPTLAALGRTLEKIHAERGIEVSVQGGPELRFRGERQDLEELMGNVMDNACKWAETAVCVSVTFRESDSHNGLSLILHVDDDGPGLAPADRASVFNRGTRLDEVKPGSGLGLAIARDIAGLYGGDISMDSSPMGGLRVIVVLPGARGSDDDPASPGGAR